MTTCDRCRKRPAVCVVGATRLISLDDSRPTGTVAQAPLEAMGMLAVGETRRSWYYKDETLLVSQTDAWLQLCAVCSGRL